MPLIRRELSSCQAGADASRPSDPRRPDGRANGLDRHICGDAGIVEEEAPGQRRVGPHERDRCHRGVKPGSDHPCPRRAQSGRATGSACRHVHGALHHDHSWDTRRSLRACWSCWPLRSGPARESRLSVESSWPARPALALQGLPNRRLDLLRARDDVLRRGPSPRCANQCNEDQGGKELCASHGATLQGSSLASAVQPGPGLGQAARATAFVLTSPPVPVIVAECQVNASQWSLPCPAATADRRDRRGGSLGCLDR